MSLVGIIIKALYGLSFFVLGMFVTFRAVTSGASHIRRRFFGLAVFGLLHAVFEWLLLLNQHESLFIDIKLVWAVAAVSFLALFRFALEIWVRRVRVVWTLLTGLWMLWGLAAWYISNPAELEVFTRIALGAPAALAAAYAYVFDKSLRTKGQPVPRAAMVAGLGFILYGVLQFFSAPGDFFPATILNTVNFASVTGVSCSILRSISAVMITLSTLTLLGNFALAMEQKWQIKARELNQALVNSQDSLMNAQRIGNMGSWQWDVAADHIDWSDQVYCIFGVEKVTFTPHYRTIKEKIHPEDRPRFTALVERVLAGKARYDCKHRIVLPSGEIRHVHSQGDLEISSSGRPLRVAGTLQDITQQCKVEDALRQSRGMLSGILAIAQEAIILTDSNLRITLFSQGAQRVFGYEENEATGMHIAKLIPERFRPNHGHQVRGFAAGPEASLQMNARSELVGLRKSGEEFPIVISLSKLESGSGNLYSLILRDVGPEKAARDELIAAKIAAETANQAKSSFLANMSHELRTPLNAIIGFSEVIREQTYGPVGSPEYLEYIKLISQSGEHLLDIINDILDVSKIDSGEARLHEGIVDVSCLVRACMNLMKVRAEAGGVSLTCDVSGDVRPLMADGVKLKQILINLLSNAIKFTPERGEVALKVWSAPEAGYVFQVADTGIGIALEDIPVALAPFKQIDNDFSRQYEGTGLGLPLAKSLVEMHSGSLDLQSEPGVGTTATIRLPGERIVEREAVAVG